MKKFLQRRWHECLDLGHFLMQHWLITGSIILVYGCLQHYVMINVSSSLPYRVAWIETGAIPKPNDLIVYRFTGQPPASASYLKGSRLFKRVIGVEGDPIDVHERLVHVAGQPAGWAKTRTRAGEPLDPVDAGRIPPDHYFVQADHPDSFDSRYAQSGLVHRSQIIGVAHVIF